MANSVWDNDSDYDSMDDNSDVVENEQQGVPSNDNPNQVDELPPLKKDESSDPEKDAEVSTSSIIPAPVLKPVWQMRSAFHPHLLTVITPDSHFFNKTAKCSDCAIELNSHAYAQCREHLKDADGGSICEFLLCINCIQQHHVRVERKQVISIRQYVEVKKETGEILMNQLRESLPFGPHTFTLCSVPTSNGTASTDATSSSSSSDPIAIPPPPLLKPCCTTSLNMSHWQQKACARYLPEERQRLAAMHHVANMITQTSWQELYERLCQREGWIKQDSGVMDENRASPSQQQQSLPPEQRAFEDALRTITTYPSEFQQYLPNIQTNVPPPELHLPTLHNHPLRFYSSRYSDSYTCNICSESGTGAAYACDACSYDAHLSCVIPKEKMILFATQCNTIILDAIQYFLSAHLPNHERIHTHQQSSSSSSPSDHEDDVDSSLPVPNPNCHLCHQECYPIPTTLKCQQHSECSYHVHLSCLLFPTNAELMKATSHLSQEDGSGGHVGKDAGNTSEVIGHDMFKLQQMIQVIYTLCQIHQSAIEKQMNHIRLLVQRNHSRHDPTSRSHSQSKPNRNKYESDYDRAIMAIENSYKVRDKNEEDEEDDENENEDDHVLWKCSSRTCVSDHTDRTHLTEFSVYRCEECQTNLCLECAASMHAQGEVQIIESGLECDTASVQQWCTGDGNSPAIDLDKINKFIPNKNIHQTYLMHAIETRDLKKIVWLLQNGADIWKCNSKGKDALLYATETGDSRYVSLLLAYKSNRVTSSYRWGRDDDEEDEDSDDEERDRPRSAEGAIARSCTRAASIGALEIMKLFLQAGAKPEGNIRCAAGHGHFHVVQYLLSKYPHLVDDPDCTRSSPLQEACHIGNEEIVQFLLQSGAEIRHEDSRSHTCLWQAVQCQNECPKIIATLLEYFKKPIRRLKKGQCGVDGQQVKYRQPFCRQDNGVSQWEDYVQALIQGKGYGSHLALILPYDTSGEIRDKCRERQYPSILIEAAEKGHLTFVDVVLKEMAKQVVHSSNNTLPSLHWTQTEVEQSLQAMRNLDEQESKSGKVKGKAQNTQDQSHVQETRIDGDVSDDQEDDEEGNFRTQLPFKSSSGRFLHRDLTPETCSLIINNSSLHALLSFPHIYYASEGGPDSLRMVEFALDYLCLFPIKTILEKEQFKNIPTSVRDVWSTKEIGSRKGFTVMHAACASKSCSRALIQMLMKRGANPVSIADLEGSGGTKSSSSLTDELSRRTPLHFLLRNRDVSAEDKLEICSDMAMVVRGMYEDAIDKLKGQQREGSSSNSSLSTDPSLDLLRLFAKQMSADGRTISIAWKYVGCMFDSFVPGSIPSATAEQLASSLNNLSLDVQKQLLFDPQLSEHVIMSLLPLLANTGQFSVIQLLGENQQTRYILTNSSRDHLSALSVLASSSFATGVDMILTNHPSPALTNSCDSLGRGPIKIALGKWIGPVKDAATLAQAFIQSVVQQYKFAQSSSPPPHMTVDQWLEAKESGRKKIMDKFFALPVATLNIVRSEYDELRLRHDGSSASVDLLAHTEYADDNEYGQLIRLNPCPNTPNPLCPVPLCQLPLEVYCSECARYLCANCVQVQHRPNPFAAPHAKTVSIADLKERYQFKYRALKSIVCNNATGTSAHDDDNEDHLVNEKLTSTATQRHDVLQLLFSGAGKFDMTDLLEAIQYWSFDILNFRTKDFASAGQKHNKKEKQKEKDDKKGQQHLDAESATVSDSTSLTILSSTDEEEDSPFCSTLLGNRSILHLAALQQDAPLIDSLLYLLLQPKLEMKLLNTHQPFKYYQLLIWGNEESGVKLSGLEFYHHQTQLTQTLSISNIKGEKISWPFLDNSSEYKSSGGQTLIYITAPHPLIFTHYELLDGLSDEKQQPIKWQLSGSNDDRAEQMHSSVKWFVVHRYTRGNVTGDIDSRDKSTTVSTTDEALKTAITIHQDSQIPKKRFVIRPAGTKRPAISAENKASSMVPITSQSASPISQVQSRTGRLSLLDMNSEHTHSNDSIDHKDASGYLYYRWLFTSIFQQFWRCEFEYVRFFSDGENWTGGLVREGILHGPDEKTPVKRDVFYPRNARQLSIPYPTVTNNLHQQTTTTRVCIIYEFEYHAKITGYSLLSGDNPHFSPNRWKLYATNEEEIAKQYKWSREIDPENELEKIWTLIDEQEQAPFPQPNSTILNVDLQTKNTNASTKDDHPSSSSSKQSVPIKSYLLYRLDILSTFSDTNNSHVTLSAVKMRDTADQMVLPEKWINPHGEILRDSISSLDSLNQHDSESCWMDYALGSRGESQLIACFSSPTQLHSYQFCHPHHPQEESEYASQSHEPPRSWTLAGSNDKQNWTVLQTMTDAKKYQETEKKEVEIKEMGEAEASEKENSLHWSQPIFVRERRNELRAHQKDSTDKWVQRRQHNGSSLGPVNTSAAHDRILQATVNEGEKKKNTSNQLILPSTSTDRDTPIDAKEQQRILVEKELHDLIQRSPRSLIRRIRKLFDPDAAGLTPRDYALTLPVSRTLRRWERVLGLSPLGTDAIVVFQQPQLIDADIFVQFFRTIGKKIWDTITCLRKEDEDADQPKDVSTRMEQLAHSIEHLGLAVNRYHHDGKSKDKAGQEIEDDPTSVLLISASYSRLLLECSSHALQDDPQYAQHRKLTSDLCLPAHSQKEECSQRVPFTTAQRQALVMRILSGLGADIDALSTLQHYKLNNVEKSPEKAMKEDERTEREEKDEKEAAEIELECKISIDDSNGHVDDKKKDSSHRTSHDDDNDVLVNVVQMMTKYKVKALSLMHNEAEKLPLDYAWRHGKMKPEFDNDQKKPAEDNSVDVDDQTADDATSSSRTDERHRDETVPEEYPILLQPFTLPGWQFALIEGEDKIDAFSSLTQLRSYAGDRVAFLFAFFAYTIIWQFMIFTPGMILTIYSYFNEHNPALPWNSVFVMVWSTIFIDRWHRKSSELAYKYGTLGYQETEAARPEFRGWSVELTQDEIDQKKAEHERRRNPKSRFGRALASVQRDLFGNESKLPFNSVSLVLPFYLRHMEVAGAQEQIGVLRITCRQEKKTREQKLGWSQHILRLLTCTCRRRRPQEDVIRIVAQRVNPITDEKEDFYPEFVYNGKVLLSTLIMLAMMVGVIWINLLILNLKDQYYTDPTVQTGFAPYWKTFIGILTGVTMKVLQTMYLILTEAILVWENHRTESAHSNAKIVKTFCFSFVNSYFSLFYIALTADTATASHELATQLVSVMASRTLTGIFFEDVLPFLIYRYMIRKVATENGDNKIHDNTMSSAINTATNSLKTVRGKGKGKVADESVLNLPTLPPIPKPAAILVSNQSLKQSHSPIPSPSAATGRSPSVTHDVASPSVVITVKPEITNHQLVHNNRRDRTEAKQAWAPNDSSEQAPAVKMSINIEPNEYAAGNKSSPAANDEKQLQLEKNDESHGDNQESLIFETSSSHLSSNKKKLPTGASATSSELDRLASQPLSYHVGTSHSLKKLHKDARIEILRPAAPSLLDNYLEIITQIGYVTCFSAVFPAAPLLVIGSLTLISHCLLYKYLHISQRPMQERAADIGAWVEVLTFLSFASILSNCILIFHSSDQWEQYSGGYSRQTCMLGFALILFIYKVILMATIPDQAGWVTTKLRATKYRQDKLLANEMTQSNGMIAKQKRDEHEAKRKKTN